LWVVITFLKVFFLRCFSKMFWGRCSGGPPAISVAGPWPPQRAARRASFSSKGSRFGLGSRQTL
jgi:hypothetical protein